MGWSVATAGDVDGDGFSDVLVSAPSYDDGQADEGRAFLYGGRGGSEVPGGEPFCLGDGTEGPCPCLNSGAAGHGCANPSFPSGAQLEASGRTCPDTVVLSLSSARPNAPAVFIVGGLPGMAPLPYNSGLLCVGPIGGLVELVVTDANGDASTTVSVSAASGTSGGSGVTRQHQAIYLESPGGLCGPTLTRNMSNGYEITW